MCQGWWKQGRQMSAFENREIGATVWIPWSVLEVEASDDSGRGRGSWREPQVSTMNATSPNEENVTQTKIVVLYADNRQFNFLSRTIHTYLRYLGQWNLTQKERKQLWNTGNLKETKINPNMLFNKWKERRCRWWRMTRSMMETDKKNSGRRQGSMRDARETFERRLPAPTMESEMNGN